MMRKEDLDKKILENRNADEILNDNELEKVSGGIVNKGLGQTLKELAPSIEKIAKLFAEEKSNTNKV